MSLAIGAAAYAVQRLSSLFSDLSPSTPSSTPASPATADAPTTVASPLTGSTQPSLSGQILATLMRMQNANGSGSQSIDPLQNLFTAMDGNGDGAISQSEMETYMGKAGASQGQADSLYASLNPTGANGITETQLGAALPTEGAQGAMGHHHHHHAQGTSSSNPVDTLMQAIDSNGDGSIDQGEMTSFVTANGGTAAQAQSAFSTLAGSNGTSINSADLSKAWETLQQSQGSNWGGPIMLSMLNAFTSAASQSQAATTVATA